MAENRDVIVVAPYSPEWAAQFASVKRDLEASLAGVRVLAVEHVGSTAVVGLAAKPILDIDVIVQRDQVQAALAALQQAGYRHAGDHGFLDREALLAPDDSPRRHVYVCTSGTLHVRNHLAVREVLRTRPDLRDAYANVKRALAADPTMTVEQYLDGKTNILQQVLAAADLTDQERQSILRLNASARSSTPANGTTD